MNNKHIDSYTQGTKVIEIGNEAVLKFKWHYNNPPYNNTQGVGTGHDNNGDLFHYSYIGITWELYLITGGIAITSDEEIGWSVTVDGENFSGSSDITISSNSSLLLGTGLKRNFYTEKTYGQMVEDGTIILDCYDERNLLIPYLSCSFNVDFNCNIGGEYISSISGSNTWKGAPTGAWSVSFVEANDIHITDESTLIKFKNIYPYATEYIRISIFKDYGSTEPLAVRYLPPPTTEDTILYTYEFIFEDNEYQAFLTHLNGAVEKDIYYEIAGCFRILRDGEIELSDPDWAGEPQMLRLRKKLTMGEYAAPYLGVECYISDAATIAAVGEPVFPDYRETIIKDVSTVTYQLKPVFYYGASLKKYTRSDGIYTKEFDSPNGSWTTPESGHLTFTVFDTNKFSTSKEVDFNFIEYFSPTCDFRLTNLTGSGDMTLKVSGKYYHANFGVLDNTLALYYRYKNSSIGGGYGEWAQIPDLYIDIDAANMAYSASLNLTGFDYTNIYYFEVKVVDLFKEKIAQEQRTVFEPVFDWSKNDFNVRVPTVLQSDLTVNGNLYIKSNGGQ